MSAIIHDENWRWPVSNSPDLITLKNAIPDTWIPEPLISDKLCWLPSASGHFSIKSAWQALRVKHPTIYWHNLIWFPLAIPKCSFILWLAIKGRLGTQGRLHLDNLNLKCLLCNSCMETHDHLFFHCTFSRQVWDFISLKCKITPVVLSWEDRITQMVDLCSGNSLTSSIRKLCLATTIYCIWTERNRRFHEGSHREAKVIIWDITDLVRCRLVSSRKIPDNEDNQNIQSEWGLPDSIFDWSSLWFSARKIELSFMSDLV